MTNPPVARTVAGDVDRVLTYTLSMVDWAQMYPTDPDSFAVLRRLLKVDLPDAISDHVHDEIERISPVNNVPIFTKSTGHTTVFPVP